MIDQLFEREEFSDYWSLKWCDLLRVKSEFPINLWPNAVQTYHRWIRQCIRENRPYDEFVRQIQTASGSNFRVPEVNFYRAVTNRDPEMIAAAVALTFMGTRVDCKENLFHGVPKHPRYLLPRPCAGGAHVRPAGGGFIRSLFEEIL